MDSELTRPEKKFLGKTNPADITVEEELVKREDHPTLKWLNAQVRLGVPTARIDRNSERTEDLVKDLFDWSEWTDLLLQCPYRLHCDDGKIVFSNRDCHWKGNQKSKSERLEVDCAVGPEDASCAGVYELRLIGMSFSLSAVQKNKNEREIFQRSLRPKTSKIVYVGKAKSLRNNFSSYKGSPTRERIRNFLDDVFKTRGCSEDERYVCTLLQVRWFTVSTAFRAHMENILLTTFDYPWNMDNNDLDDDSKG